MKNWQRMLVAVAVLAMSAMATAQVVPPQIGVFFDNGATMDRAPLDAGDFVTAYVCAVGGQMLTGGASFKLDVYPDITVVSMTPVVGSLQIGDPLTGVDMGFYDPHWVDDNNPLVLYSMVLTVADRPLGDMPITVTNAPNYSSVVIAQSDGELYNTTGLTGYITPPPPVIGVFFDTGATTSTAVYNGGTDEFYTAYIFATGGPILMAGASFKLDLDPSITLVTTMYEPSLQIGDLLNGVEIGLYDAKFVDPQHPGLLATMILTTGNNLVDQAPLCIVGHPSYGAVMLADPNGDLVTGEGMCSYITIPVANENRTWSEVKDLYR